MRVVSLACSNTEIVCALGCAAMLVAVDNHSDRPADVLANLPRVGPDLQIDVANVAALEPDLVLASSTVPGHEKVIAALAEAALPYRVLAPQRLEDIYRDIAQIADWLQVPQAGAALIAELRHQLRPMPAPRRRPRLLLQWWNRPTIAPGQQSWVNDLMEAAGGRNALQEACSSRPLSDEEVVALEPDAIIISWCGVNPEKYRPEVIYRNPRWQQLLALQQRRVYCVPEAFVGRPSPGLATGFRQLAAIVQRIAPVS